MDNQEQIYAQAEALAEKATTAAQVKEAVELFRSIAGYRDAGPRSVALNTRYDLLLEQEQAAQAREEEAAAKRKKLKSIIIAIACAVGVVALFALLIHSGKLADYRDAEDLRPLITPSPGWAASKTARHGLSRRRACGSRLRNRPSTTGPWS